MAGDVVRSAVIKINYEIDDSPLKHLETATDSALDNIKQKAEQSEQAINELAKAARNASNCFDQIESGADSISEVVTTTTRAESAMSEMSESANDAAEAIDDIGQEIDQALSGTPDIDLGFDDIVRDAQRVSTEIDDTAGALDKLGAEAGKAGAEAADDFNVLSAALDSLKGAALSAGAAFGASTIFSASEDLTKSMNQIQASTGLTGKELEKFSESAKTLYTSGGGESLDDVARSMSTVKQITGVATGEVEKMTNSALTLRDTFGFEVNESVRSVDMIMQQFGVDSNTAFGMLAQGAQLGLDQNGNLLDSFNEYSVHFKKIGFGAEGMMTLFANVSKQGVFDIDKIGDAVKEFSIRAIDGSKTTAEGFAAIGMDAGKMSQEFAKGGDAANTAFMQVIGGLKDMKDPVAQDAAGVALFGTMWEDIGKNAIFAMADTTTALGKAGAAMDKINEVKYDDATTALAALGRTLNVELGEAASVAVNKLRDVFQQIKDSGAISAIFDGIGSAVNGVVAAFSTMLSAATSTYGFISANWGAIGPIFYTIAGAIGAVISIQKAYAAGLLLQAAYEGIRAGAIATSTAAMWENTAAMLANPWTWIVIGIVAVIAAIILCVVYWDEIKAAVMSWVSVAMEWLQVAWDYIAQFFTAIWTIISEAMQSVWAVIVSVWTSIWGFIGPLVMAIWNFYYTIYSLIFQFIGVVMQGIWNIIVSIWNAIWVFLSPIITAIWSFIVSKFNQMKSGITSAMNYIRYVVVGFWNAIKGAVLPILSGMWDAIKSAFQAGLDFVRGLVGQFISAGADIIQGLISGMTSRLSALTDVVSQIGSKVVEGTRALFKIGSPSRIMAGIGENIVQGQEVGMLRELPHLQSVSGIVANATLSKYTPENTVMPSSSGSTTENNSWAPQFNLTVNGGNERELERKVRLWVGESMREAFAGLSRSNPRLREV